MYKLRDYQQKSHDATMEYLKQKKPKPGIVVAPTGSGKSILIAKLAQDYNEKVLVLCPSQEILSQNYEKFISIGGEASIYSASLNSKEIGHVTFASIGSVKNLGAKFKSLGVNLLATDECLSGETRIETLEGTIKMSHLFKLMNSGRKFNVKSFNESNGQYEYKPILNIKEYSNRDVVQIETVSRFKVVCTPNHKFLTNNGWKRADSLVPNEDYFYTSYLNSNYYELSEDQLELMKGSLLGDGGIDRRNNNMFRMRFIHGKQQKDYLYWKAELLNQSKIMFIEKNGYAQTPAYSFNSTVFFTPKELSSVEKCIDSLTPKSLAILWMDDGHLNKNGYGGSLYTCCHDKKMLTKLALKLNSFGIYDFDICTGESSSTKRELFYLRFRTQGILDLSSIIHSYVHMNLQYKIHPWSRVTDEAMLYKWDNTKGVPIKPIRKVITTGIKMDVYDIEVKDNHNFILSNDRRGSNTLGIISHNCHLGTDSSGGMFKTFLNALKPEFNLGFTATPFRLKQYNDVTGMKFSQLNMLTRTRPKLYSNFIHVTQIQELTVNEFWAPIEIENHNLDTSKLFLNSTGAEYNQESIERVNKAENTNNKIYKRTKELMLEKNSILIFMDNVENCYTMKKALGSLCEVISGETDKKERIRILSDFKVGKIKVVCCFMTLVVGFDFPALDCVIMGRPTNSLAVFYQIYGRLTRPYEGKKALFIDYGGNINKFGRMEDLTIENYEHDGWGVYSGQQLLTGVSMSGPKITKSMLSKGVELEKSLHIPNENLKMNFGKYNGVEIKNLPIHYIKWLFDNEIPLSPDIKVSLLEKIKPTN